MTISSETRKAGPTTGNGVATAFPFAFKVFDTTNVKVTLTTLATGYQSVLILNTDYTLVLNADQNASPGGTVTYNPLGAPISSAYSITISSNIPNLQGTDLTSGGAFLPDVIENMVDKAVACVQQLQEQASRSIRFPVVDAPLTGELPAAAQRSSMVLGFDASGNVALYSPSSAVTSASNVNYLAAGTGAVSRTVESKLREKTSVADYGIDLISTTPWQNAINSTPDGSIAVLDVSSATYTPDLSALAAGTRTLVWMERGGVTYSTAAPPGNRMFSKYLGDATRPWFVGNWGFACNTTSGTSTDRPVMRIQRDAGHNGGTPGGSINAAALSVQNTVGANVQNYENAIVAQITSNTAQTVQTPNLTVFQGTLFKEVASTGGFFGVNFVARDETKLGTVNSKGGLVGGEIDVVASGPDTTSSRIILDLVGRGYDASADGVSSIFAGMRVRAANTGVLSAEPMTLLNGIVVDPGSLGAITTGILVSGKTGASHIEIQSDNTIQGVLKVGSQRQTATNVTGQIVMTGWNSANAKVNYGALVTTISLPTAGAENGSVAIQSMRAGTLTTEVTVAGGVNFGAGLTAPGVGIINVLTSMQINNTKVIGARKTGWSTWTGTAARGTFDTATATLVNVAQTVKALIDDFHSTAGHGLIGT